MRHIFLFLGLQLGFNFTNGVIIQWGILDSNKVGVLPISFLERKYVTLQAHQGTAANNTTIIVADYAYRNNLSQIHFIVPTQNIAVMWTCIGV